MYDDVKIIPTSPNGFIIEVFDFKGKVGRLEIGINSGKIYILRREGNFKEFIVKTTVYKQGEMPKDVVLAETHNLELEFK